MLFKSTFAALLTASLAMVRVNAESHTVTFDNKCGTGTPYLRAQNGDVLSTGAAYTIDGPLIGAIAYLQTGNCGNNGEGCTLVETTLENDQSSTDISLIPPHAFSVTTGFGYYNGCDVSGCDCTSADCTECAFFNPDDTYVQVPCTVANCDLVITFCD